MQRPALQKVHSGGPGAAGVAGGGHGGGTGPAAAVAVAGGLPPVVGMAGAGLLRYRGLQPAAHQRGFGPRPGAGVLLAVAAGRLRVLELLLWPYVTAIKSVPVASFIIICLIWMSTRQLAVFISLLMVFPVIYSNTLQGIKSADGALLEMAWVYRVPFSRRLGYIYAPQVKPFLLSGCSVALGMSWKSGVAAEVIGVVGGSIGERLYEAKVYFQMTDLLAWTVVIVVCSVGFEKLVLWLLRRGLRRVGGTVKNGPGDFPCLQGLRPRPGAAGREPDGAARGDGVPDGPLGPGQNHPAAVRGRAGAAGKRLRHRCSGEAWLCVPGGPAVRRLFRRGQRPPGNRPDPAGDPPASGGAGPGRQCPAAGVAAVRRDAPPVAIARAVCAGRSFCCWTRPSRAWTISAAGTPWPISAAIRRGRPCCASPTTRRRPPCWGRCLDLSAP